jgi:hypothetical protein
MAVDPLSLVSQGTRGAATILQPFDAGAIAQQEGKMAIDILERKEKQKQDTEGQFRAYTTRVQDFSEEVWEQDLQQFGRRSNELIDGAASMYQKAYNEGRSLSPMEQYQIQRGLSELGQMSATSKANKKIYEDLSMHALKHPDKIDVEQTIKRLNVGYRDKTLGERSIKDFMVLNTEPTNLLDLAKKMPYKPRLSKVEDKFGKTVTVQTPDPDVADQLALETLSRDQYYIDGLQTGVITKEEFAADVATLSDYIQKFAPSKYGVDYSADAEGRNRMLTLLDESVGSGDYKYDYVVTTKGGKKRDVSVDFDTKTNVSLSQFADPDRVMNIGKKKYRVISAIDSRGGKVVEDGKKYSAKSGKFVITEELIEGEDGKLVYGNTVLLPYSKQHGTEGRTVREALKSINDNIDDEWLEMLDKKLYGETDASGTDYSQYSN